MLFDQPHHSHTNLFHSRIANCIKYSIPIGNIRIVFHPIPTTYMTISTNLIYLLHFVLIILPFHVYAVYTVNIHALTTKRGNRQSLQIKLLVRPSPNVSLPDLPESTK